VNAIAGTWRVVRPLLALGTALAAALVLLLFPAKPVVAVVPQPAVVVWAQAKTGAVPATLPDGTAYTPLLFLDAATSVGSAPTPDGTALRLVLRDAGGSLRLLRSLPAKQSPFFGPAAAAGDDLTWVEGNGSGVHQLTAVNLRDGRPPRQLVPPAAVAGFVTHDSPHDLAIAAGRLHWATAERGRPDVLHARSVALAGGPPDDRVENGSWQLSAWPWLVDGVSTSLGATKLRNLVTGRDVVVHRAPGLATTSCGPAWCEVTRLADDGTYRMSLAHPDGSAAVAIPDRGVVPAVGVVVPLDRFEVLSQAGPNSDLTRTGPLLVHDLTTRRTVALSQNASEASYAGGVLWWTNGNQQAVWHSIDLRTV
jgi:hypothetical protein